MSWFLYFLGTIGFLSIVFAGFIKFLAAFLERMYLSIQPEEPDPKLWDFTIDQDKNPLFRQVPSLKNKLAWTPLGEFPTKIHQASVPLNGSREKFWMKREDLCSPLYGGSKVRTLQFALASCAEYKRKNPSTQFYVVGSGGSNQVVASIVHGAQLGIDFHARWLLPDEPDLDNSLNLLSSLSFGPASFLCWDRTLKIFIEFISALWGKGNSKVVGIGGNSVPGALGQIAGALELAEQIANGDLPDPDAIYLPMGSSCTTTGLIIGICLARKLGIKAFNSKRFKLVSVSVDERVAFLHRWTKLMYRPWSGIISPSPWFGIPRVCQFLKETTGGKIDLEESALKFLQTEWEFFAEKDFIGKYGTHSKMSKKAADLDVDLEVKGELPNWMVESNKKVKNPPSPWLCGHFAAKSFATMIHRLEKKEDGENVLRWQTKSYTQPLGMEDEWEEFRKLANGSEKIKKWANEGKAHSKLRPGKVDCDSGKKEDYRSLMTPLK